MTFGRKNTRERLVFHVQELERLEALKREAAELLRDSYAAAEAAGYDPITLKVVLKLRKMTPEQRRERRALETIYLAALGMLEGDPLTDEARRRLDPNPEPPPDPPEPGAESPEPVDRKSEAEEPDRPGAPPAPPEPVQPPLVLKTPEEARQEGTEAAAAGKRVYDNPYPAGDPCRAAWDEGWCAQRQSHGMDTPAAYQRRTKPPDKDDKRDPDGGGTDADQTGGGA